MKQKPFGSVAVAKGLATAFALTALLAPFPKGSVCGFLAKAIAVDASNASAIATTTLQTDAALSAATTVTTAPYEAELDTRNGFTLAAASTTAVSDVLSRVDFHGTTLVFSNNYGQLGNPDPVQYALPATLGYFIYDVKSDTPDAAYATQESDSVFTVRCGDYACMWNANGATITVRLLPLAAQAQPEAYLDQLVSATLYVDTRDMITTAMQETTTERTTAQVVSVDSPFAKEQYELSVGDSIPTLFSISEYHSEVFSSIPLGSDTNLVKIASDGVTALAAGYAVVAVYIPASNDPLWYATLDYYIFSTELFISDPSAIPATVGEQVICKAAPDAFTLSGKALEKIESDATWQTELRATTVGFSVLKYTGKNGSCTATYQVQAPTDVQVFDGIYERCAFYYGKGDARNQMKPALCLYSSSGWISDPNSGVAAWLDDVQWTSANPAVATVDQQGNVTAVGAGNTTIEATAFGEIYEIPVAVKVVYQLSNHGMLTFQTIGQKQTITVTGEPEKVLWGTENEAVATVDANGIVTAVGNGTTTIFAIVAGETLRGTVTVNAQPTINRTAATICIGGSVSLAVCNTSETVTWLCEDETVASVSKTGLVKGLKAGKVTIYAVTASKTFSCNVKVTSDVMRMPGDVNGDEKLDIGDVILLCRILAEDTTISASKTGLINADCVYDGMLDANDSVVILKVLARLLDASVLGQPPAQDASTILESATYTDATKG